MLNTAQKQHTLIDGHRMAYFTAGDPANPAILLVHGWLSHSHLWDETIDGLKDRFYCVAMDVIGLGDSDKPIHADYSIAHQARQIVELADKLAIEKFALIGHSRGGQIALQIAANTAPQRVTAVVDVAGCASGKLGRFMDRLIMPRVWLAMKLPVIYDLFRPLGQRVRLFSRFDASVGYYDIKAVAEQWWHTQYMMGLQKAASVSNYATGQSIHAADLTADLSKIRVPVLVLFGQQDRVVPISEGHLVAQRVPGAKLMVYDQCGHFVMYEKTAAYLQAITDFLSMRYPG